MGTDLVCLPALLFAGRSLTCRKLVREFEGVALIESGTNSY
jgi:hypothetical protein